MCSSCVTCERILTQTKEEKKEHTMSRCGMCLLAKSLFIEIAEVVKFVGATSHTKNRTNNHHAGPLGCV